ncbi:S41 family peptidase [Oceanobacillus alkalisoli]|uniref:S41 family peptidase n=1 Tax=Oceanobacillus alkalisoli TaxID=2925113 RepID=UPI001EF02BF4|nr:S41 family peptidase [Oceanobacillus alkalisoli]MCF3943456.1 S41 family peptidase [Oceanobacillus alkalisoli]MCG5104045.1 S41 family peptidase [Oceanobacillus alkalisoli]
MKLNRLQIVFLLAAALVLGFLGAYAGISLAGDNDSGQQTASRENLKEKLPGDEPETLTGDLQKIEEAYALIQENYVEEVEGNELVEGAIEGMLATLEDPHSSYLNLESMDEFNQQIESSFEGIGAEVSMVNGVVTIVSPIKDSPAEKAGLRPNDQVLTVDGEDLEGLNLNEAVAKIRGEKGTEVTLEIIRAASDPFDVVIVRDTIPVETVYSETETIDGNTTGIIEITNFSENTATEFMEHLNELEESGLDGLVIDVRGNPGGLLNVVEDMLALFVPEDLPFIQIEDAEGNVEAIHSDLKETKEYPISVLIDEGSASASEILAVALKELDNDIVGQTSYGKGTVQTAVPLGDGSSIKLTTFKWLSPSGEWINEVGVEPTIPVDQPDYYYANPITIEEPFGLDDTDEGIANIQLMLDGIGYDPGRMDGYFSEETEEAVKQFQEDNDLSATGEVDEETAGLIDTRVIEQIRSGEDDVQLEKALEELYK